METIDLKMVTKEFDYEAVKNSAIAKVVLVDNEVGKKVVYVLEDNKYLYYERDKSNNSYHFTSNFI